MMEVLTAEQITSKIMQHCAYGNPYQWKKVDFELGASLGRGTFGRVYLAREKTSKFMVAMKVMFKSEFRGGHLEKQILREIEIQSHLKHPNILPLYTWFHDERRIYLALEVASEGDLYKHLMNAPNGRFDEHRSAKYTNQVANALHYCHLNSVMHRDLKPGILCYEFLVGKPPFEAADTEKTYAKIRKLKIEFPKYVSTKARDLISKLLQKDKMSRITLVDVMQHPWIKENMISPGSGTSSSALSFSASASSSSSASSASV